MTDDSLPLRLRLEPAALPLIALGLALAVCAVALLTLGASPGAAAGALWDGAFGDARAVGETALKSTVLCFTGLAVVLPLAAGCFNVGGQGQFLCGAVAAAFLGRALALPAPLELPVVLLGAAAAGAVPGALAGVLKAGRGVHEVISTILLNWAALYAIDDWLVVGPLAAARESGSFAGGGTAPVVASAHLPLLLGEGSRLNLGFPLALVCAVAVGLLLRRTRLGLEIRALGDAPETARAVGVPVARRLVLALALGGAMAGLGGACMILGGGTDFRYPSNYRDPYGFDGIAVALLGAGHPLGAAAASVLFGALRAGAVRLQDPEVGLHRAWPEIFQALAVLFVAGRPALRRLWRGGRHK